MRVLMRMDDPALRRELAAAGVEVLEAGGTDEPDVLLTDPAGLASALGIDLALPVIVRVETEEEALHALEGGADDAVVGGAEALVPILRRALARRRGAGNAAFLATLGEFRDLMLDLVGGNEPVAEGRLLRALLQRLVALVPGADAGSLVLADDRGSFRYAATVGYDLELVQDVVFTEDELGFPIGSRRYQARLVTDLPNVWPTLGPERERVLRAANGGRIRVSMIVPIEVRGRLWAALYCDSFESEEAFGPEAVRLAEALGAQLGLMLGQLEQRVAAARTDRAQEAFVRIDRLLTASRRESSFLPEMARQLLADAHLNIEGVTLLRLQGERFEVDAYARREAGVLADEGAVRRALATVRPDGSSLAEQVTASGLPAYLPDLEERPAWAPVRRELGVRSVLALPLRREGRAWGVLTLLSSRPHAFDEATRNLARQVARIVERAIERAAHVREIEATREATMRSIGQLLERRDVETKGHTDRVVRLSCRLGERLGLDGDTLHALRWGAYLHDVGKIAMPDSILFKPGRLTEAEFGVIQQHAVVGHEITQDIPFLPEATRLLVRHHHERWDGRGYPDGLAGADIPLLARLFSVADRYDALTSSRPYKPVWAPEHALEELRAQSGTALDPELVPPFARMVEEDPTPGPVPDEVAPNEPAPR